MGYISRRLTALGMVPVLAGALSAEPVYAAEQKAGKNYATEQPADPELLDALKGLASMLREGYGIRDSHFKGARKGEKMEGAAFLGWVPAKNSDGWPRFPFGNDTITFVYVDVGNDGLNEPDVLTTVHYHGKNMFTFVDKGVNGPTRGDKVMVNGREVGDHKHPLWQGHGECGGYKEPVMKALGALRAKGAIPRKTPR